MTESAGELAAKYRLDGRDVEWHAFGEYTGFEYTLLDVNVEKRTVEMVFRFEPNQNCFNHRHVSPSVSLVLEGEHHIFEQDGRGGTVRQVRPAGTFAIGLGGDIHIEGGGDSGATVYFSMRGDSDHIYDILDEDLKTVREVSIQDFARALEKMRAAA
jgi:hypothetical protein